MLADGEGGGKRTLDLQAHSHDEVSVWTRYFRQVVERGQLEAHARRVAMRAQPREAFLEMASQVCRHDPHPNPDPDPNQVRRDALKVIQRCWKPLVRQWLSRARASLATPHSFAAANVLIDQLTLDFAPMTARVRDEEARRIQSLWRGHCARRQRRFALNMVLQLQLEP